MKLYVLLTILGLCVGLVFSGQNLHDLINSHGTSGHGKPSQLVQTPEVPRPPRDTLDDCTCVPYYLCNKTIITDGEGLIDVRLKECDSYLEVCCMEPNDDIEENRPTASRPTPTREKSTTPPPTEEPIRGTSEKIPVKVTTPAVEEPARETFAPAFRVGCGKRNPLGVNFRITGEEGGESEYAEFPWMVAVLIEEEADGKRINAFQCGGSLIHPEVVMTAAHCVKPGNEYKVRLGEWDTQTENELYKHQDAYVASMVIHPEFNSATLFNDIALLFLESPVTLAENVDVVCMPEQDQIFDNKCFVTGWGKNAFGKEGKYQVILKKIELPLVPRDKCLKNLRQTRLGNYFNLHKSFICAGGELGKDACKGDGGSPLVCPIANTDRYAQVGIVAWGIRCGEEGLPGVYTNVPLFRSWVDEQLQSRNVDKSFYYL